MTTRILILDDHALLRRGLCRLIDEQHDMVVVAEAETTADATQLAVRHQATVVLLDLQVSGRYEIAQLVEACPQVRVIALTGNSEPGHLTRALAAGAHGYVGASASSTPTRRTAS